MEVHQATADSSDLGFDLELVVPRAGMAGYPATAALVALEAELAIPVGLRPLLWTRRAGLFAEAGEVARAEECLAEVEKLDPGNPSVPYARARLAATGGDQAGAYPSYLEVLKKSLGAAAAGVGKERWLLEGVLAAMRDLEDDSPLAVAQAVAGLADGGTLEAWELGLLERRLRELAVDEVKVERFRVALLIGLGQHADALALIEAIEKSVDPARDARRLLEQKEACYRALGDAESADATRQTWLFPPRPAATDAKQIDLSAHYNASLYDGAGWGSASTANLASLPEIFAPLKGVGFDRRGIVQLECGPLANGETLADKGLGPFPLQVAAIEIGQKAPAIHFLTSSQYGGETRGVEVASFVMHYADGSSETLPVKFLDDVADWYPKPNESIPDAQVGWRGSNAAGRNTVLSELVWQNPHPEKEIASIDFISAEAKAAPFLLGITLE